MILKRLYHDSAFDPANPVESYWAASAPAIRHSAAALTGEASCDVAVIGGGFTGLWTAYRLARDYGMDVRVLDAAAPGWGASGRNGGFCCVGSSKLPYSTMVRRYGRDAAQEFVRTQWQAIDQVRGFLDETGTDAMTHSDGELELAHRPKFIDDLKADRRHKMEEFGEDCTFYDKAGLAEIGASGPEFHAGMVTRRGFALHPMRYARALADAAASAGATLHGDSPVTSWTQANGRHVLKTPGGTVTAKHAVLATNGYSSENLPDWMAGRTLPVMTSIIVTRPLTEDEKAAQGWTSDLMSYDSRRLLHYFRLLPDNRFMFGGRGGIDASPEGRLATRGHLTADFNRMYPAWKDIPIEYNWSGFVCLAADLVPYIGRIDTMENAWTAFAYHGNGVAMASWSGATLAGLIAGNTDVENAVPAMVRTPPRRFPLPWLRLAYLRAAYFGYKIQDEYL